MNDDTVLSKDDVDKYLETNFLSFVLSMYSGNAKAHTSFGEFFKLLVQAISKLGLKKDKVAICIFTAFSYRKNGVLGFLRMEQRQQVKLYATWPEIHAKNFY